MAILRPFRAWKPAAESAARVAAVPYDVVTTEEARAAAAGDPLSFLHVSRAEIDLPDGTNPYSDEVYSRAAVNFETLKKTAPLLRDDSERLYVYRLRMGDREQTGIAGCASLDDYDADLVRKHERTRKDKEDDRTRHMVTLRAQTGPVFLTYRGRPEIDRLVKTIQATQPLFDFRALDGVAHTVWQAGAEESRRLSSEFLSVPLLYIADGHHRAASASRARKELAARASSADPAAFYNFFIVVAFPAAQVRILPYNRVVRELGGRSAERFLQDLEARFSVTENAPPTPERPGDLSFYLAGRWYGLRFSRTAQAGALDNLDADLLQRQVLEPLFQISDIRTDKRVDFVGGVRGPGELSRLVDSGKFAVAFSLYPVSVDQLIAVADANEIMPPKSTWFEPKLKDGLLIHEI